MSEEVKETASTATEEKTETKDPNQPTDFSLDNLKLQFEECLKDDNTISLEKYILGMIFFNEIIFLHFLTMDPIIYFLDSRLQSIEK